LFFKKNPLKPKPIANQFPDYELAEYDLHRKLSGKLWKKKKKKGRKRKL